MNHENERNVINNKRRAIKLRAVPVWYGLEKIRVKFMYHMANLLGLTIDHTVPLNHPLVCGLHTLANLQLMSGSENSAKCNKFEV